MMNTMDFLKKNAALDKEIKRTNDGIDAMLGYLDKHPTGIKESAELTAFKNELRRKGLL